MIMISVCSWLYLWLYLSVGHNCENTINQSTYCYICLSDKFPKFYNIPVVNYMCLDLIDCCGSIMLWASKVQNFDHIPYINFHILSYEVCCTNLIKFIFLYGSVIIFAIFVRWNNSSMPATSIEYIVIVVRVWMTSLDY